MNIGMLWARNKHARLDDDIEAAVEFYRKKYGGVANMVHVNPRGLDPVLPVILGVEIRKDSSIQPGYLWIGVSNGA